MRLILGVLVSVLAACGAAAPGAPSGPSVLDAAGGGFQTKLSSSLDLRTAAASTPAATVATQAALARGGYSAGSERVFTRGGEFVTVLAFQLSTDVDAGQLVAFERDALHGTPSAVIYDDAAIPGSFAFDLAGGTRQGNKTVFCQGVWFAAGTAAYELTDCAGSPRYPDLVESLALKQYRQAS